MNLNNYNKPFAVEASSSSSGVSSHYASRHPQIDSAPPPATSSTSAVRTENRYMKDPRNNSRFRSPTDASHYGGRNDVQLGPQFSGHGSGPQMDVNSLPLRRETGLDENDSSKFPNMSQTEQASFYSPSSPRPNYGMFNQVDNAPGKQSVPAETNRYRRRNPPDAVEHTGRRVRASPSPRF